MSAKPKISAQAKCDAIATFGAIPVDSEDINFLYQRRHLATVPVRVILGCAVALIVTTSAQAQILSIGDMIARGIQACQAEGRPYDLCNCYVNRWVGLWSPEDRTIWSQTGQSTPHMFQMQSLAMQQCGGRL